jgi:hypothetical protein
MVVAVVLSKETPTPLSLKSLPNIVALVKLPHPKSLRSSESAKDKVLLRSGCIRLSHGAFRHWRDIQDAEEVVALMTSPCPSSTLWSRITNDNISHPSTQGGTLLSSRQRRGENVIAEVGGKRLQTIRCKLKEEKKLAKTLWKETSIRLKESDGEWSLIPQVASGWNCCWNSAAKHWAIARFWNALSGENAVGKQLIKTIFISNPKPKRMV